VAKGGTYTEFDLAHKGYVLNQAFKQELESKEIDRIITSIDRFIEYTYMRSSYMANTTKEERSRVARKNGKKGGRVKQIEAYARILGTINQMQSFDIKITVSEVARRAKSKPTTVRAYFKEKGWKQVSRKEGWKNETNS
jgi:hypothetical protein